MFNLDLEIKKFCSFDEDKDYDEDFVRWWVDHYFPQYWDIDDVIEDIGTTREALIYYYHDFCKDDYYDEVEILNEEIKVGLICKAIDRSMLAIMKHYCNN